MVAEGDDVGPCAYQLLEVATRDPEAAGSVLAVDDHQVVVLPAVGDERHRGLHAGCGEDVADEQDAHATTIAGARRRVLRVLDSLSMQFDTVDKRLLELLREDGRASHASLAKAVGLSAPAVGERVRKLEQAGVIKGFRAVLDPEAVGLQVTAFVMIAPQPRKPAKQLVERLTSLPEVEAVYSVAG